MRHLIVILSLWLYTISAYGFELGVKKVSDSVYALVGEINKRTIENKALNNTLGFVITDKGVVLVGTGAFDDAAKLLEDAVKSVTDKPIIQVISIGSQDHQWMGNGYFIKQKIPVMALKVTVDSQNEFKQETLQRFSQSQNKKAEDFNPVVADHIIDSSKHDFKVGTTEFSLRYLGKGHFPGDAVLWLPQQKIVFSGDFIFNDRLLGVHPDTSIVKEWAASFKKIAALKPEHIIPGHGYPSDLATAQKSTGDYLDWLLSETSKAVEEMEDLDVVIKRLKKETRFDKLKFYKQWNPRNISQTYLQIESE